MKWYKSLIFKILLCCVMLTLCLIGSIVGVLYVYQQSIMSEMETKSLEVLRLIQVGLTNVETEGANKEALENQLLALQHQVELRDVEVRDLHPEIFTRIQPEEGPQLEFGMPEEPIILENRPEGGKKVTAYIQAFPLKIGQEKVGDVKIAVAISPQTHLVKVLRSKVLISFILMFFGTIIALCYFILKLLQPLHQMAATCQEISEGNLHEIDIKPNASEVLVLETKFNEMINALKAKAEMERKLAQTQRLSSLGNLAAGVAHEIGNPLNGIKLTISHLKDIFLRDEIDKPSFSRYADTVLGEVNRLDGIVKDFLILAKERDLSFRPYGLHELLTETVRLIEKDARKKGVSIETDIASGAHEAMIDPPLLKSALLNILINAIEASGREKIVKAAYSETDGQATVKITDQGTGIPEEIMDRVFEPYFSTKSTGTGLGLSLTRTIIEKHGGELSIESQVGQGTTVTVTVPVKRK